MTTLPLVINVILNTNRRKDTLDCLESLERSTYPNQKTLVLDNASTDGSVEAIEARFSQVKVIALERNLGYAGNNNVGIRAALDLGADWVFILNEDIVLEPNCTSTLITESSVDSSIGILGPLVYHFDEPQIIQSAGGILDENWCSIHIGQNEPDCEQFVKPRVVDWISGCAILVSRQVIEQVGSLDERFFYYWEETEWCLRANRAGWKIVNVPGAKIWHKGVQRNYLPSPNVSYYATRNWLMMMAKHHAPVKVWIYVVITSAKTLLSWTLKPKWRSKADHRKAVWQGIMDFLRHRHGMRSV